MKNLEKKPNTMFDAALFLSTTCCLLAVVFPSYFSSFFCLFVCLVKLFGFLFPQDIGKLSRDIVCAQEKHQQQNKKRNFFQNRRCLTHYYFNTVSEITMKCIFSQSKQEKQRNSFFFSSNLLPQ